MLKTENTGKEMGIAMCGEFFVKYQNTQNLES